MTTAIHKQPGKHRCTLEAKIPAIESRDGNDRTERTCPWCGSVMITVHGRRGNAWRRWRTKDGIESEKRPPCIDTPEVTEVPAI